MNRLIKTPRTVYVPAVKAIPGHPAYTWSENTRSGYTASGNGTPGPAVGGSIPILDNNGNVSYMGGVPSYTGSGGRPQPRAVIHSIPAYAGVVGVPAHIDIMSSVGWNGGARSYYAVPQDGYFQVAIPKLPTGIVVGISDGRYNHTYGQASHAVAIRKDQIKPIGYGVDLAAATAFVAGSVVRFERRGGEVTALVDGVIFHQYSIPSTGDVYSDVTLYGMSDYVDDAEIGFLAAGVSGFLPRLLPTINDSAYCYVSGRLPRPTLDSRGKTLQGLSAVMPSISLRAGRHYSVIRGALPTLQLTARMNEPEAVEAGALGVMPPHQMTAFSFTGNTASMAATLPAITGKAADSPYCEMRGVWGGSYSMQAWEPYLPAGMADGREVIFLGDIGYLENSILLITYDGISIEETVSVILLINLEAYDYLGIGSLSSFTSVLELAAYERIAINSNVRSAQAEALQFAVNAITGALTTYQNFGFTQFARIGRDTYAIRADGLYRLGGKTDAGAAISASVDFGAKDYGTSKAKIANCVYAGINTDGQVYIRLSGDDGVERTYLAQGDGVERRALAAKGIVARHWRLRLSITDASYADLDNIEVQIGATGRRIGRQ